MSGMRNFRVLITSAVVSLCFLPSAMAQFGFPAQLPDEDFVWMWGRQNERAPRRFEDFSVNGSDGQFRCDLTGKMSVTGRMSPQEIREMENQLRASLYFVQESASTMYQLDLLRELDWAMLDCRKHVSDETESEAQEREDKARERAERKRERRRARDDN